jgi:ABC-2 type transport system ATP-binding protein
MADPRAAIEIRGLSVVLGGRTVINNLSLEVPRGSVFAVIGPNGCGKTTLIRSILGLQRPTSGEIRLAVAPPRAHKLNGVGVLFDRPWLYDHLTADENIRIVRLSCGLKQPSTSFITSFMASLGLLGCGAVKVGHFSAGMRQRLGIALTLLNDPDLLVLDEPLTGLDPCGVRSFCDFARWFVELGKTILWSSHQLTEVQRISSHVAFMSAGQLLYSGPLSGVVEQSPEVLVTLKEAASAETLANMKKSLAAGGFGVAEVEPFGVGSLETAYLALIGRWPS